VKSSEQIAAEIAVRRKTFQSQDKLEVVIKIQILMLLKKLDVPMLAARLGVPSDKVMSLFSEAHQLTLQEVFELAWALEVSPVEFFR
jgi:glycerol dehydrogenase-like iron-containing ADH family enzyme